jgi:protein-disulfide isomerase
MRLFPLVGFALFLLSASAQESVLESIDTTGFSKAQKNILAQVLETQNCTCGCNWTIARCRKDDPKCGYSRQLLNLIIKDLKARKDEKQIVADLKLHALTPPPVLDGPVTINIQGDPVIGPEKAKVTIVEFSDFQCPYCAAAVVQARTILQRYPKDVRLVFKQFPLDDHSQAFLAAEAAVAAHAQGKFWEMHDKLYDNYRSISAKNILVWGQEIGLDMKRFVQEIDSGKYKSTVDNEIKQGENAGVQGTPTFFFNGRRYSGAFQADAIAQMLQSDFKVPLPKQ